MNIYATAAISLAAAVVTFIAVVHYRRNTQRKLPARVEKAKALGHAVKACRIKEAYHARLRNPKKYIEADYSYEVDGKSYRYRYCEPAVPPAYITLYYINDPKKAFWGESLTFGEKAGRVLLPLLPFLVFVTMVLVLSRPG